MTVEVKFDLTEFEEKLARFINENAEQIAQQIATDARASVKVVTGNLRKGIRAKKSRFDDGGWIVVSTAPHAWLVEYGRDGGRVAAAPYLRPALNKNINLAREKFGAR